MSDTPSYGPNLATFALYLMAYQHVSVQCAAELIKDLTGAAPSTGWIAAQMAKAADLVAPALKLIKALLILGHVLHADETATRTGTGTGTGTGTSLSFNLCGGKRPTHNDRVWCAPRTRHRLKRSGSTEPSASTASPAHSPISVVPPHLAAVAHGEARMINVKG